MTESNHKYGIRYWVVLGVAAWLMDCVTPARAEEALVNASYDVSREFYQDYNARFVDCWQAQTGEKVQIAQSHGGSSNQVRAIVNGLDADVATMNQRVDIDELSERGLVASDWRSRLPDNAAPFTSTIVFLVRPGNPKNIRDWDDLIKPGVQVIIPNPKTSGNGRYSYLAAWGYAAGKYGWPAEARKFVGELFQRVPVVEGGGRGATHAFIDDGIGDALLTFENEAQLFRKRFGDDYQIVVPSVSVEAELPVAVVDKVVDRKGTRRLAEAYLKHLWSEDVQRLAAEHYLRPRSPAVLHDTAQRFAPVKLLRVEDIAGSWANAQKTHFDPGGVFDQLNGTVGRFAN